MKLSEKIINIYDKETNPIEKCNKIKNEWNNCCNTHLKNNTLQRNTSVCEENTKKCLKLFDEYTKCFIENFSHQTLN